VTYEALITGISTQLSTAISEVTVLKATPYKRAGTTPIIYVYPNLYNSTPVRLRRVNKTFTCNIAIEKTCRTESDYISLWSTAESVYAVFEVLDDYFKVDSVCFLVRNISARYYKDVDDIAYVLITVTLEQLSDD